MISPDLTNLRNQIQDFSPLTEQEQADQAQILAHIDSQKNLLTRDNTVMHFTASAWIVNPARTKVLMIYHNIYDSWSWTGGHADGEKDLYQTALREAGEETGLKQLEGDGSIFSLEILCVNGHIKKGAYVSSHLHLNVTYLFTADEQQPLRIKPDENSGVAWIPVEQVIEHCTEPWMHPVYRKLLERM